MGLFVIFLRADLIFGDQDRFFGNGDIRYIPSFLVHDLYKCPSEYQLNFQGDGSLIRCQETITADVSLHRRNAIIADDPGGVPIRPRGGYFCPQVFENFSKHFSRQAGVVSIDRAADPGVVFDQRPTSLG